VNARALGAAAATLVLLVLPVLDFLRDGRVSDSLVAPLVLLAFGGGGYAADRAVKSRIQDWVGERRRDTNGNGKRS
jgi:hypothetical protein